MALAADVENVAAVNASASIVVKHYRHIRSAPGATPVIANSYKGRGSELTICNPPTFSIEWRDIPGWPGYQASSSGEVRGKTGRILKARLRGSTCQHLSVEASFGPEPSDDTKAPI